MKRGKPFSNYILEKIANKNKLKLLRILRDNKKLNQLDLQKKLGISYKETRRYINSLHRVGLVKKKIFKKKPGSPVFISLRK